jgi:WD40 repeat protein
MKLVEEISSYHDQVLDIKKVEDKGVLVCTNSDYVRYYDLATKKLTHLIGHKEVVTCCDYFNGRIITGSKDGKLFIWEFKVGENSF